jgi:hypothetical protein
VLEKRIVEEEVLVELPARLETSSFFSPVIVVAPQIAIAVNGVDFGGAQISGAMNDLRGLISAA